MLKLIKGCYMGKKKELKKDYVDNKRFLELLREYELLNDDIEEWFLRKKPKNEQQENFQERKKELLKNRIKLLDNEDDDERNEREKKLNKVKNELGKIFLLISNNFLQRPNFINYDQLRKDEMQSEATYFMCQYIERFDTTRDNPFAYFSQLAYFAFLQCINKHNKRGEYFQPLDYVENLNGIEEDFD
jgi:hypothetical protein